jgi:hypothetical protein
MTPWLHMFSWVVLHVPIKSYDLVLPIALSTLNIQDFFIENNFIQPKLRK